MPHIMPLLLLLRHAASLFFFADTPPYVDFDITLLQPLFRYYADYMLTLSLYFIFVIFTPHYTCCAFLLFFDAASQRYYVDYFSDYCLPIMIRHACYCRTLLTPLLMPFSVSISRRHAGVFIIYYALRDATYAADDAAAASLPLCAADD